MASKQSIVRACMEGDLKVLQMLLRAGKDPNERDARGRTGLHISAVRGLDDLMDGLLAEGADVGAVDKQGNTALHCCGHTETIHCLLDYGASVHVKNNFGATPLAMAKRRGVNSDAVELLQDLSDLPPNFNVSDPELKGKFRKKKRRTFQEAWYRICLFLGPEKLVIFLLVAVTISLGVAYAVADYFRTDSRIPIDATYVKEEL